MMINGQIMARLEELMRKPNLSLRSSLIIARRIARHICEVKAMSRGRDDNSLGLQPIRTRDDQTSRYYKTMMRDIGKWVCEKDEELTQRYGITGLCDLLEVNPVHRLAVTEAESTGQTGLVTLVFVWALEDSANLLSSKRSAELKDGPLYQAVRERVRQLHLNA